MKKLLTLLIATAMLFAMTATVFAENGGFVSSPSNNLAPTLSEAGAEAADGTAVVVELAVTPYIDRTELDEEGKAEIEAAYAEIAANADLTTVAPALKDVAAAQNIPTTALAVADLFDISDVNETADVTVYHVTLSAETLKNFVALIHFVDDGVEVVESAKIEGGELVFSIDGLSPFAIVVNSYDDSTPPQTGDAYVIGACAAVMAVSAVAFVAVYKKGKKSEEN